MAVPTRIEIFYYLYPVPCAFDCSPDIYTCERHHLEQKSHDKLFISASKVDTPPNIDRQTFLCRDTETPVAKNQPQWHKKQLLCCVFTPEDQLVAKKLQER